jgi:hypothetical protein
MRLAGGTLSCAAGQDNQRLSTAMHVLGYRGPQSVDEPTTEEASPWPLIVLPIVALVNLFIAFGHAVGEEPFMVFTVRDALIEVGAPLLVVVIWAAWFLLAMKRHRLAWHALLVVACWAMANIWVAQWIVVTYFREPWRTAAGGG